MDEFLTLYLPKELEKLECKDPFRRLTDQASENVSMNQSISVSRLNSPVRRTKTMRK